MVAHEKEDRQIIVQVETCKRRKYSSNKFTNVYDK